MKSVFKKIALTLTFVLSIMFTTPIIEAKAYEKNNQQEDVYAEKKVEIITIDGINYTYKYCYENGNKVITIINDSNNNIEKIVQDKISKDIYLNNELVMTEKETIYEESFFSPRAYYEWETKSSSSTYISWGKATTAAALAAIIATKVGTLGPKGVIAAMGIGALGVIASQCAGGRVYTKIQMFRAPLTNPQYRTIWAFKASTGDYYGDYIYHW